MEHNIYIYIAVMALVTYAIRVLPLTLIRKEIKNPFIRSFLYCRLSTICLCLSTCI
jgi:branched-subunit amino acid transport protein